MGWWGARSQFPFSRYTKISGNRVPRTDRENDIKAVLANRRGSTLNWAGFFLFLFSKTGFHYAGQDGLGPTDIQLPLTHEYWD